MVNRLLQTERSGVRVPVKPTTTRIANTRSGQRLTVAIPVRVSGKDVKGKVFTEETRTTEVNRAGCRVCLSRETTPEHQVHVALIGSDRVAIARVAWVRASDISGYWDVGLELKEAGDFWSIQFPGEGEWKPKAAQEAAAATQPAVRAMEPESQIAGEPAPPVIELDLDPLLPPPVQPAHGSRAGQADLTDLLNAALNDAVQEHIRSGLKVLATEAQRRIDEVKRSALEEAEAQLRNTIASCGEDFEIRAIDVVGRNEQALERTGAEILRKTQEQIQERVDDASTKAAEAIQQMLDMANIGCTRLKEDTDQAIASAANSIRQKLSREAPQIEDQLVEQCQTRTARLLNSRMEEIETSVSTRMAFLSRELSSRTEEVLSRFELELERRYNQMLTAQSEHLEKLLEKAAEKIQDDFTRRLSREIDRRQEELFQELESRTNTAFTQNLNRTRRLLARSVRDLGETLQQEADTFGTTGESK